MCLGHMGKVWIKKAENLEVLIPASSAGRIVSTQSPKSPWQPQLAFRGWSMMVLLPFWDNIIFDCSVWVLEVVAVIHLIPLLTHACSSPISGSCLAFRGLIGNKYSSLVSSTLNSSWSCMTLATYGLSNYPEQKYIACWRESNKLRVKKCSSCHLCYRT